MMWGLILLSRKTILRIIILIYFGGTLIVSNKDIPFCDHRLKKLKEDMKEVKQRCSNETEHQNKSTCCTAETAYSQDRMRMHSKMCFYKGTR